MALKIEWSKEAYSRVEEIHSYLTREAGKRIANKIAGKIVARTKLLVENPQAGQREELLKRSKQEFRYLVEGNYKIVYRAASEKVVISAVFDCRQNPEKMREELE